MVRFAGLWSALAFAFNLAWEIAHVSLYTIWLSADGATIARAVFHCTLGDVVIALGAFALAGIVLRRFDWPMARPLAGCMIVTTSVMAFTVWSEWYNVYRTGGWGYAPKMPTIYGIGLSPLLQWLLLPPVLVLAFRALLPVELED